MLPIEERRKAIRPELVVFLLVGMSFGGCRWVQHSQKASPDEARAVLLTVVGDIACSDTSPLPPAQYRPKSEQGVRPVIVVEPKYGRAEDFELGGSLADEVQRNALSAIKGMSGESGNVSIDGATFSCGARAVLNTDSKWRVGDWDAFQRSFPGAIGWVRVSKVALSADGNTAYVCSRVQWGALAGESDLWILSRKHKSDWSIVQMRPISRS